MSGWKIGLVGALLLGLCACRANPPPAAALRPPDDEIVVCGQRFHIGTPVVTWEQFPGYSFYGKGECFVGGTRDPEALRAQVDQFVLHFDVCGISRTCYRVLLERKLSVHFMLDVDGTLYQALDLAERAWHATKSNTRSIGVEIANLGAYPPGQGRILDEWYAQDADGPYLALPARLGDGGIRTAGFVARPARPAKVVGETQGETLEQYDFTPAQYAALEKLAAGLARVFPRIEPEAPRAPDGAVARGALSDEAWKDFHGILGHYHVQQNKTDPGPAFDWEDFLAAVRAELGRTAP
ncbi:MAG: N-acetylmuramoyl-L-alanine amidase [Planctomycetes bacterium]|nr:N-acetylmuramoyl-L-alanine amidase [Planctomycetota bacterium]